MIATLPALTALQFYMANAIKNLKGLGFKFWMPYAFQTDDRLWTSDGRIVLPNTKVFSANGYTIGNDGLLHAAIANRLRISRGHTSAVQIGAFLEQTRTNLALRSEELGDAAWANDATVTSNTDVAPDGLTTADKVEDTSITVAEDLAQAMTVANDSLDRAFSIFIKKTTGATVFPFMQIEYSGGTFKRGGIKINTNDGTLTDQTGAAPNNKYVQSHGDYWRAVIVDSNNGSGNTTATVRLLPAAATTGASLDVTQIGSVIAFGGQFESSLNQAASSYIKTLGSTVTRTGGDFSYDNTAEVLVEAAEGTIFIIYTPDWSGGNVTVRLLDARITAGDGVLFQTDASSDSYIFRVASGGSTSLNSTTTVQRGVPVLLVGKWRAGAARFRVNGVQEASAAPGAPTGMDTSLDIAGAGGFSQADGVVSHVIGFNRFLTDRQIQDVEKTVIQPIAPGLRLVA